MVVGEGTKAQSRITEGGTMHDRAAVNDSAGGGDRGGDLLRDPSLLPGGAGADPGPDRPGRDHRPAALAPGDAADDPGALTPTPRDKPDDGLALIAWLPTAMPPP